MNALKPIEPNELRRLSRKYGNPRRRVVSLGGPPVSRSERTDRRGEVVLAIRGRSGKFLLHTKSFYPEGTFRFPSGGIHLDEAVEDALYREVAEETALPVEVEQFIALIEYKIGDKPDNFASYVFLLSSDGRKPSIQDVKERIAAFKEVAPSRLRAIAKSLRNLPADWRDWGEFRAVPHELVAEELESSQQ